MGYPAPGRRTLRRVARPTEHRAVGDVEWSTADRERDYVIDGEIARGMGGTLVARAPVAVLATPGAEDAGAETSPGPRAVLGVVAAAVGRSCVGRAATAQPAGRNAAHRAELHHQHGPSRATVLTLVTLECTPFDIAMSVNRRGAGVYSPAVLRL